MTPRPKLIDCEACEGTGKVRGSCLGRVVPSKCYGDCAGCFAGVDCDKCERGQVVARCADPECKAELDEGDGDLCAACVRARDEEAA